MEQARVVLGSGWKSKGVIWMMREDNQQRKKKLRAKEEESDSWKDCDKVDRVKQDAAK